MVKTGSLAAVLVSFLSGLDTTAALTSESLSTDSKQSLLLGYAEPVHNLFLVTVMLTHRIETAFEVAGARAMAHRAGLFVS